MGNILRENEKEEEESTLCIAYCAVLGYMLEYKMHFLTYLLCYIYEIKMRCDVILEWVRNKYKRNV